MAATTTRRPAAADTADGPRGPAAEREPRQAVALGVALLVACAYTAFASGAIDVGPGSRLQVGVALVSLATLAGLLYGRGLHLRAPATAAWGAVALALFAGWSAVSIAWSAAPDESWLEANRTLAFALVAGLGLVLGSSLPRAVERAAVAFLALSTVIVLYALGGKVAPWLHIGGLIDLNQTGRFSRLRAPLNYWNALGMVCVLAIPVAMRVVTELRYATRWRLAGLGSLTLLLVTLALTYSRGGLIVGVVAVALTIGLGPERLRLALAFAAGLLGAVPAYIAALSLSDLTTDGLSVSDRTGAGLVMGGALILGLALAALAGRWIIRRGESLVLSEGAARNVRRGAVAAAAVALVVVVGGLALSDRGLTGTISHQAHEFTKPKLDRQNDPARVLQTNSGNRWVWWEEAWAGFTDRPLEGYGAGSFPVTHRIYRQNAIEVRQPHSVPLEFLTETGIVGALLGLGALALLGVGAVRTTRARAPGSERAFSLAVLAAAAAFGLHLFVDWDWEIPGVTLPVLILLGVLAARGRPAAAASAAEGRSGRAGLIAAGVAATVVVIALAALPAIADGLNDRALDKTDTNNAADLRSAERDASLAKRLNPFAIDPLFTQATIAERGNQPRKALQLLVDAVDRQPDNGDTWARLLRLQLLVDDAPGARRSLQAVYADDQVLAFRLAFLGVFTQFDPARSASATGTPLPVKVKRPPRPAKRPSRSKPKDDTGNQTTTPQTPTPAPQTPTPAPQTQTPTPTPTPTPKPAPKKPQPKGDPFRLEG